MNKRIKELAEQAGFYFYDMHDVDGEDLGETIEADSWTAAEKFADMIIKECAKVCYRTGVLEQDERTGWMYGDAIQEHFGVE